MADKASQLTALLAPTVDALGLELLGIEYLPAPGGALVRLYIDRDDAVAIREASDPDNVVLGVTIEHCESVSREVSAQLDVEDPITGNYTLEVSSPGVERPLFNAAQFARAKGEKIKVGLKLPQDGRRRLQGIVVSVEGDTITFDVEGATFVVDMDNIDKARLMPDWAALGLAPSKEKKGRATGAAGKAHNTTRDNNPPAAEPSGAE